MPIVYPINPPATPAYRLSSWTYEGNTAVHGSPFNNSEQLLALDGQRWRGTLTLPPMFDATARAWRAFGAKLNGRAGMFLVGDPTSRQPAGSPSGSPTIDGVVAAGTVDLPTTGWPASTAGLLLEGDYIQLPIGGGSELKMVLQDVDSDGSGDATIIIGPPLHKASAGGETIGWSNPVGRFRLAEDAFTWNLDVMTTLGISFAVVEAIPNV